MAGLRKRLHPKNWRRGAAALPDMPGQRAGCHQRFSRRSSVEVPSWPVAQTHWRAAQGIDG